MKHMMNAPPGTDNEQKKQLWERIQNFPIDDPTATLPFSRKLANQQKWTYAFTLQAIAEYRKFVYLCCTLPQGASPSKVIDEVWHLHLLYTQNYWEAFCGQTLERPLHHHPSTGGKQQYEHHLDWQQNTLQQYRHTFGTEPPEAIWRDDLAITNKPNLTRRLLTSLRACLLMLPFVMLTGCDGSSLLFLIFIPVILFVSAIIKAVSAAAGTANTRKKGEHSSDSSGSGGSSCSSSGCGSSGCGGGGCGGGGCGGGGCGG